MLTFYNIYRENKISFTYFKKVLDNEAKGCILVSRTYYLLFTIYKISMEKKIIPPIEPLLELPGDTPDEFLQKIRKRRKEYLIKVFTDKENKPLLYQVFDRKDYDSFLEKIGSALANYTRNNAEINYYSN